MRTTTWLLASLIGLAGSDTFAQTTRQMGALTTRDQAPTDKAIDHLVFMNLVFERGK